MELAQLEVYSSASNCAIITPPGRMYPGCVIPGDSLSILCDLARNVATCVQRGDTTSEDFLGNVEELANSLIQRILHFQQVLEAHGIDLPYAKAFSESDLIKLLPREDEE